MGLERGSTELLDDFAGDTGVRKRGRDTGVLGLSGDDAWYSVSRSLRCIEPREIGQREAPSIVPYCIALAETGEVSERNRPGRP